MAGRAGTFDHDADIGVVGEGETLQDAFAAAARAMFGVMVDLDRVRPARRVHVVCEADDVELLFVRWLNALLAEADLLGMVFSDFDVRLDGTRLDGIAHGEPFDEGRHTRGVEVKGATLTELKVAEGPYGWRAQTVVDV